MKEERKKEDGDATMGVLEAFVPARKYYVIHAHINLYIYIYTYVYIYIYVGL